jgi:hypothetical protein
MVRYHRMRGRPTLWLPGTDHAGIATQVCVRPMSVCIWISVLTEFFFFFGETTSIYFHFSFNHLQILFTLLQICLECLKRY